MGKDEPLAAPLDEIISKADPAAAHITATAADLSGVLRMVHTKVKGAIARRPEECRAELKTEGNVWAMLATKFASRS